ncbi:arylesterase [Paenirhodobacter enshiensis]|uniref:arylesterase n=1 Tax=Paenirhodobacter enshiensis TaxID=1105367 RepID=UPI0035AF893A
MRPRISNVLSKGYGPGTASGKRRRVIFSALAAVLLAVAPLRAQEAPVTLLALGDSLTQGYGLPQGDGLVPQLQAWLQAHGHRVNIVNAGVSGDTTAGGRARIGWSLTPDVQAVMIALGGNDMLRALPPAQTRANIDAMLSEVNKRGLPVLLAGLAAPGNYGPDYQHAFNAIWPEMAAAHGAVLVPDLLAPLAALSPEERAARGLMQADNIHPSAAGVKLVVEALGPRVETLLAQVK